MSFIGNDEDLISSVEETLAFVDSFDWEGETHLRMDSCNASSDFSTDVQINDSQSSSPDRADNVADTPLRAAAIKKKPKERRGKAKRKRCTLSSSTRLQQQKRAEILYLQKRAQEMEDYIKHLRHSLRGQFILSSSTHKSSNKLTEDQFRARFQSESEERNLRLREILANQVQLAESLKKTLRNGLKFQEMEFVDSICPVRFTDFVAIGNESAMRNELQRKVSALYLDSFWLIEPTPLPSLYQSAQIRHDSRRQKKMVEIVTTTPVSCSMEIASKLVWKELHNNRQYPDKWYQTMPGNQPNTMKKNYVILLRSESQMLKLSGMQYLCRFDEPTRTVFVGADTMLIGTTNLRFYNHTWIVVTPSPINPAHSSVIHMRVLLSVDAREGCSGDIDYAKNRVLSDLYIRFRQNSQYVQNWIVEETERMVATMPTSFDGDCIPT